MVYLLAGGAFVWTLFILFLLWLFTRRRARLQGKKPATWPVGTPWWRKDA